jgi:hypothetical protein
MRVEASMFQQWSAGITIFTSLPLASRVPLLLGRGEVRADPPPPCGEGLGVGVLRDSAVGELRQNASWKIQDGESWDFPPP